MKPTIEFSQLQPPLTAAKDILLIINPEADFDGVAAALSLFLSLKKTKEQSQLPAGEVAIICPKPMTVEFSSLVGVDQIKQKWQGNNLTISFDYPEDSIEKVSYNIENHKFNLLIQPKKGFKPLATDKIEYHYSGQQPDLVFTIGVHGLADLGKIYLQNKGLFDQTRLVNIDLDSGNQHFGKINLIDARAASLSEIVALMLIHLSLAVDVDIATNLLSGLQRTTAGFDLAKTSAMTFEAAAFCLRAGAARLNQKNLIKPKDGQMIKNKQTPSPDWLEPKIYKGNTLI